MGRPKDPEKAEKVVMKRLRKVIDPHTGIPVVDMKMVTGMRILDGPDGTVVKIIFRPDTPACPVLEDLKLALMKAAEKVKWVDSAEVAVDLGGGCNE